VRVPELVAYQDADWARRWAELVRRVHVAEQERAPGHSEMHRGRGAASSTS
jgi:hypothetical protein